MKRSHASRQYNRTLQYARPEARPAASLCAFNLDFLFAPASQLTLNPPGASSSAHRHDRKRRLLEMRSHLRDRFSDILGGRNCDHQPVRAPHRRRSARDCARRGGPPTAERHA